MASQSNPAPKSFELLAGHPVLDFVNTLDDRFIPSGPVELINTYGDLLRFTHESGLLSDARLRKLKRADFSSADRTRILLEARRLRETLASAAYALVAARTIPEATLTTLETYFKQAATQRRLTLEDHQLAWRWKGLSRSVEAPLWLLSESAADLFLFGQLTQLRDCASDTCRWLFLDQSKNHSRRWCNMGICGNRNKARQFQLRQAAV
jgi:predicted RNA-binding Zn ribbon-like protein